MSSFFLSQMPFLQLSSSQILWHLSTGRGHGAKYGILYTFPRRYASLGLPYSYERIPTEKDLSAMLLSSPIIHAAKVSTNTWSC